MVLINPISGMEAGLQQTANLECMYIQGDKGRIGSRRV